MHMLVHLQLHHSNACLSIASRCTSPAGHPACYAEPWHSPNSRLTCSSASVCAAARERLVGDDPGTGLDADPLSAGVETGAGLALALVLGTNAGALLLSRLPLATRDCNDVKSRPVSGGG